MNAQLAEQMKSAHQVTSQAQPHFEQAVALRADADIVAAKAMKHRKTLYIAAVVLCLAFPIPVINLAASIAAGVALYRDYKGRFTDEVEATRREAYAQADAEEAQGTAILEKNVDVFAGLPVDYWYPMATEYLAKITAAGRADNMNEALLLLDDQLHRWSIEQTNAAILAEQQSQSASLKGIRRSNAVSAVANVTNTIFNIANSI